MGKIKNFFKKFKKNNDSASAGSIDEAIELIDKEEPKEETKKDTVSGKERIQKIADSKVANVFKRVARYVYNTWIFKCFVVGCGVELMLEILGRRSILKGFLFLAKSPIVFFYNASIVFFTLLFALFLRKRIFGMILISTLWLTCGTINFVLLGYRVTPFAAIDFVMIEDAISMIDVYFKKWQLVLISVLVVSVLFLLVFLFIKTPKYSGNRKIKTTMAACVLVWIGLGLLTRFNVKHNIISDNFANLGTAYKDYGFAYCFTNSIIDNGISKPDDYSEDTMLDIKEELDEYTVSGKKRKPNIIVIQLESFFDPKAMAGIKFSEDPVPNFTAYKEQYPSGYFTVPSLGTGTANTEFEALTGIKSNYFGAGEYPYKTTVNNRPVVGLASILKQEGYGTYAIHNNKGSFYDRFDVYDEMGFDAFISLEYMYDVGETSTGWAKDTTLPDYIMTCLEDTEHQDLVYTISVQGHGRYPDEYDASDNKIMIAYEDESLEHEFAYYINQINEMDQMLADLKKRLDDYGEDYILVLYGDHMPTLITDEDQLAYGDLFQTEYVMINNIGLKAEKKDIFAYELSTVILKTLNLELGYAQKCQIVYGDDEETFDDNLELIAYDMLFGKKYLYNREEPYESGDMRYGVDVISITGLENKNGHIFVKGENFNRYSLLYDEDGDPFDTIYIDRNTLLVEDEEAEYGERYTVKQVDKSHKIRSSSEEFIFIEK